ncbi:MAG: thiamine phosphate synthase [Chloroflexi bacterium]|nr:thiamine phosphate synthase [Chloroflexota bacterium]MBV9601150.1 thiamine phosphate synthase [Chloroflexota bacterium]
MSAKHSLPAAPLLLLVTDRTRYGDRALEDIFMSALAGGLNMIELREADMNARDLLGEAERLRRLALGGVLLIVHDRVDVAVAVGAHGAHVSSDSLPVAAAKRAGRGILIGKAVSSVAEAVAAEQAGADYLVVEPVFFSHYALDRSPLGPTLIRRIKSRVRLPLLAGGGITAGNAHQVIAAGADGVSVTSEIVDAEDTRAAARALHDAMREAWPTRPLLREAMAG